MDIQWTAEQIFSFAQDENIRRVSRRMAGPEKWLVLGSAPGMVWGEFPVKEKPPIQTAVRLATPSFACSCGSRRTPCEHALGLVLLWIEDPTSFHSVPLPDWAQDRLDSMLSSEPNTSAAMIASHKAHGDKSEMRNAALLRGLQEVELWLHDLVRNGLADLQQRPKITWTQVAERLVDAGAGELAREVRRLAELPATDTGWPERLLGRLGTLYLLIQGFKQLDSLPQASQADLRTAAGWQPRLDPISADLCVSDRWHILSNQIVQEGRQRVQRTWLWGERHNRAALILQRSHKGTSFDTRLVTGTALDADVRYFPGTTPIRAQIETWSVRDQPEAPPAGYESVDQAAAAYSRAVSANPWIGAFPVVLRSVIAAPTRHIWALVDPFRRLMPLPPKHPQLWHLVALTRHGEAPVFGEWDGEMLRPLSVWAGGRWIELRTLQGIT